MGYCRFSKIQAAYGILSFRNEHTIEVIRMHFEEERMYKLVLSTKLL